MGKPKYTSNTSLAAELIQGFGAGEDGVHLYGGEVFQCFVKPNLNIPLDSPHLDGFQLIYPSSRNEQYALALIEWFSVTSSVVDGLTTPIQCIFASDGVFGHGEVHNNTLKTDGHHFISINGLLRGSVTGNRFIGTHAADYPIKFKPARPGGNPDDEYSIWVLHWLGDYYQYDTIECDTPELVQDLRQTIFNTTDKFLVNFNQEKFNTLAAQVPKAGGREMGRAFQRIALQCGDLVTEYQPQESVMAKQQFKASPEILRYIGLKENAQERLDLHKDPAGLLTIGYGHLITETEWDEGVIIIGNDEVHFNRENLTPQQMQALFAQDIEPREDELNNLMSNVPLNQNQFDALLSFVYNIGFGAFAGTKHNKPSTAYRRLIAGNFEGVPDAMKMWDKITLDRGTPQQHKVKSSGLAIRRQEEADWFMGKSATDSRFPAPTRPNGTVHHVQRPEPEQDKELYNEAYEQAYKDIVKWQEQNMETNNQQVKQAQTKPFFESKILITVAGMLVGAITMKFGELDPEVEQLIKDAVLFGGPILIGVFRKWYTHTSLT